MNNINEIDKQFKKGVLNLIILKLIDERDMYGYELIQLMDKNSDGYYSLKEGSLYPVLYRLEDNGCIESYRKDAGLKRKIPRKYYRITEKGRETLKGQLERWEYFTYATEKILKGEM